MEGGMDSGAGAAAGKLLYEDKWRWSQIVGTSLHILKNADPDSSIRKELRLPQAQISQSGVHIEVASHGKGEPKLLEAPSVGEATRWAVELRGVAALASPRRKGRRRAQGGNGIGTGDSQLVAEAEAEAKMKRDQIQAQLNSLEEEQLAAEERTSRIEQLKGNAEQKLEEKNSLWALREATLVSTAEATAMAQMEKRQLELETELENLQSLQDAMTQREELATTKLAVLDGTGAGSIAEIQVKIAEAQNAHGGQHSQRVEAAIAAAAEAAGDRKRSEERQKMEVELARVADEAEREIAEQAVRLEVRLEQANAQLVQDRERLRSAQERLRSVRKANDTAHAEQRRQLEDELRTRSRERVTRAQKSADTRVASERQSIEGKRSTAVQALQDQLSEIMHAINRAENELHDVRAMAVAKVGADIQNGASESWQDALDTQQIALDEAAMAAAAKSEAEVEVARRVEELESVRRQLGATSVTSQHDHAHMNQLSDELRSYKHSQMENANEVDRQRQLLDGIKARLRDLQAERASVESSVESDSHSEHSGHVLASANGLAHLTTHGCAWPKVNGQVLVPQQIQAAAEQLARLQQQLQQQNELRARASHEAETLQRSLRHIRREIIQIEKIDGDKMKAQLAELREATALLRFDATEVRRMRVNVEAETAKVQARLHHK